MFSKNIFVVQHFSFVTSRHLQETFLKSAWPDSPKFFHFGKVWHFFDYFFRVYLMLGTNFNQLWQFFFANGQFFIVSKSQIIYPSGHTVDFWLFRVFILRGSERRNCFFQFFHFKWKFQFWFLERNFDWSRIRRRRWLWWCRFMRAWGRRPARERRIMLTISFFLFLAPSMIFKLSRLVNENGAHRLWNYSSFKLPVLEGHLHVRRSQP